MLCAAWPHVRGELMSMRRGAAVFLDKLEVIHGLASRQNWAARWIKIADEYSLLGELNINQGAVREAIGAWLCALTSFEVARRLVDENGPEGGEIAAKVQASIQSFGSLDQNIERVQIACCDQFELPAYYLRAGARNLRAPAVICVSREEESEAALLGRLLPVVIGRSVSVLVVSHNDVSHHWRGQSLLSCCFDYLLDRPDVDAARVGVYGEGLSAVLATDFAASDRRVAAAVCDGGLWNWARVQASVGWMTKTADVADEQVVSARRSRLVRKLKCPVLVVVGGRGTVSASEASKLQADCRAARIDLELAVPPIVRTPSGETENFVTSDDSVFGWLEQKLRPSAP